MTAKKPLVRNGSGPGMSEVQLASSDLSDGPFTSFPGFGTSGSTACVGNDSRIPSTTVGQALAGLANPGAVAFVQINADNSVTTQSAVAHLSALGAQTYYANLTAIGSLANAFGCLRNDGAGNFMYSLPWPAAASPTSSPVNTDYSNSAANNVYARRKSASSRTYAVRSFN